MSSDDGAQERNWASRIDRRQAVKRIAVLGGAVAWATPVIQTVTMTSAAAQAGSPVPTTTTTTTTTPTTTTTTLPPPNLKGISFIAFVFRCGTTFYEAKVNSPGTPSASCGSVDGGKGQDCGVDAPRGTLSACSTGLFTITPLRLSGNEVVQLTVTLSGSCTFDLDPNTPGVQATLQAKSGSAQSTGGLQCQPAVVDASGQSAIFSGAPNKP